MRNKIVFSLVILLFIFISCSNPVVTTENALSVKIMESKLKIANHSGKTLYLFIVERKIAALIDWIPQFNDSKVLKYDSILVDFSEIYNGDGESVKSGDEIIIYYWDDSDKLRPEVFNKVITL